MKIQWKSCFKIGVSIFVLYLCIHFFPSIMGFGSDLLSSMTSMLIGAAIAYLVNILMSFYERHYFPRLSHKKAVLVTRRPLCLIAAFLTLIAVIALIFILIIPELVECIKTLGAVIPPFIRQALELADDISWIPQQVITALEAIDWKNLISKALDFVSSGVGDVVTVLTTAVASVFSSLVTALFAVIFSIYLLAGKNRIGRNAERLLSAYIPGKLHDKILHLFSVLNDCFHRYIVGQCIEAVILGTLCTIGMLILKLPYATMIGALIAFTALIPIAGAYIGAAVGAFMILTVSPMKALIFLIFLLILQQLEGNIIYPRVVGTSLGLPGIWVLFAVTVGGGLYGVLGMLLGVPLVATVYRLIKEDLARREDLAIRAGYASDLSLEADGEPDGDLINPFAHLAHVLSHDSGKHKKEQDEPFADPDFDGEIHSDMEIGIPEEESETDAENGNESESEDRAE